MEERDATKMSNILQHVELPVIESGECKQKLQDARLYGEARFDEKNVICTGFSSGGKDACQGDYGV